MGLFGFIFFKKCFIYLFLERGQEGGMKGRETSMCERNNDWLPLACPQPGTWHSTQACALTGKWGRKGGSLSKSIHGPFKRNCLGLQKPSVSLSHNPYWSLQPEVVGTSLPDTGTLGWGALCGAGSPHSSGRNLQPRHPSCLSSKKTITNSLVHSLQVFSIEILSYIMYKYVYVRGIVCKIDLWLFRKILMRWNQILLS